LTKNLRDEGLLKIAEVIFLKNHFAKKIFESDSPADEIRKMNKNIHAHFFAWGIIKKRPDEKSADCKYYLSFGGGYITHRPVPNDIRNELSKDFSKVLVPSICFSERFFQGFEISAQFIHLAVKYIIGLAAFISQDPQLAFKFHTGLKEQCKEFPHLQIIKKKLPFLLSEEALWIARWHEDNGRLQESKEFVEKTLAEDSNSYGGWLLKARLNFREGDIDDAFHSVKKAEDYAGARGEWRYSKAFLHFWVGEFQKALRACNKIKSQSYDGEPATCEEVIAFNLNILESTNDKPQLYFWIGFISNFKKQNLSDALVYFEKFEELAGETMPILKSKSSAYLEEIKRKMNISDTPSNE
ncbi:hypothetical protein KKC44_03980, partial [Patescibacteria group bacterium]|nr:hypothetical protein [Patescibacteria group bacterium]